MSLQTLPLSLGSASLRKSRPQAARLRGRILEEGDVISRDLAVGENLEISLISGAIWITQEGDPEDYVLHPGEKLRLIGPGKVVIEALSDATEAFLT